MIISIPAAIQALKKGGLVAFPTETVYGLGADATNIAAIQRVFAVKKRPPDHPLIVHIASMKELSDWTTEMSVDGTLLAHSFWPGPLTLIVKKAAHVSDYITGGQDTVGLRMPRHPVALGLLKAYGRGMVGPSANYFGHVSPTTAAAVEEELGKDIDGILDGGACEVGVESTIIDVTGPAPILLRPGMLNVDQIGAVLGKPVLAPLLDAPRVSGSLASHYAPTTKARLIAQERVCDYVSSIAHNEERYALLLHSDCTLPVKNVHVFPMPANPLAYAHVLYHTLRTIDRQGFQEIIIEDVPQTLEWSAIQDRIKKASFSTSWDYFEQK